MGRHATTSAAGGGRVPAWSAKRAKLGIGGLLALTLAAAAPAAAHADACPNAAIREAQNATHLTDCRAFEQVTPVDKGGTEVDPNLPVIQAAPDGNGIAFASANSFPGALASMSNSMNQSRRTASGWTTAPIDPPQVNDTQQVVRSTRWVSRDLTHSVDASRYALSPGATDGLDHVYLHDLLTDQRQLALEALPSRTEGLVPQFLGSNDGPVTDASPNLDHFLFRSNGIPLAPGALPDAMNYYEWDHGHLRLVNVRDDGTPFPVPVSITAAALGNPRRMSDDGSKVFFQIGLGVEGELYMRENGTTTKLISYSQHTGDDPTVPIAVRFQTATPDGRYVFFTFDGQMTDTAGVSSTGELYRFDTSDDQLTLIEGGVDPSGRATVGVEQVSEDGQRVYFNSPDSLTGELPPGEAGIYVWDHGDVKLVTGLNGESQAPVTGSADGRFMEFTSAYNLVPEPPSPACPVDSTEPSRPAGQCHEAYAYDAETGAFTCLSCPLHGPSLGHVGVGHHGDGFSAASRAVRSDGTYLFDTPNALVPEDTNGQRDVYAWKDGHYQLLSTGTSVKPATFEDASADGSDVFFITSDSLVSQDRDQDTDLYTAHHDGGFTGQNVPSPPERACSADPCQGSPAAPGEDQALGSLTFAGSGNPPTAPETPAKPGSVKLGKVKTVSGTAATVKVTVPAAGAISVSGSGLKAAKKTAPRAATYSVEVSLTAKAKSSLKHKGTLKVKTRVTFKPRNGKSTSKSVTLAFKRPKGGR